MLFKNGGTISRPIGREKGKNLRGKEEGLGLARHADSCDVKDEKEGRGMKGKEEGENRNDGFVEQGFGREKKGGVEGERGKGLVEKDYQPLPSAANRYRMRRGGRRGRNRKGGKKKGKNIPVISYSIIYKPPLRVHDASKVPGKKVKEKEGRKVGHLLPLVAPISFRHLDRRKRKRRRRGKRGGGGGGREPSSVPLSSGSAWGGGRES